MRLFQKALSAILCAALCASLFSGCAAPSAASSEAVSSAPVSSAAASSEAAPSAAAAAKPTEDREGTAITVPEKVERIISTAASNTEILVGLGLADKLVMVDTYSADVEGLPADILQVNFREPDAEALIAAKPDLMIVSGHNREGDEDPFKLIKEAGICVAYIPSSVSVEGILGDMRFIAALTGTEEAGEKMTADFKAEADKIKAIGDTVTKKKSVYFEIGSGATLYSFGSGTFLNEFIEIVGAVNIFADQKSWISPSAEAVLAANPDVIITNEDYKGDTAISDITTRGGWDALNAVKSKQVHLLGTNDSSRASQNAIKALKELAEAIYPELY